MRAPLSFSFSVAALTVLAALPGCDSTSGSQAPPDPTPELIVTPTAASITSGTSVRLSLSARDEDGRPVSTSGVSWTTSDANIAAVAGDGVVIGRQSGATRITAFWNGVQAASTITVTPRSESCAPPAAKPNLSFKPKCLAD